MIYQEAKDWDKWYSENFSIPLQEDVIRVEQGEYVVTELENELGTFNVNQCVVIYAKTNRLHGLAHIDGHTEINSLNEFISDFKAKQNELQISILGAKDEAIAVDLNDPKLNLEKVRIFFSQSKIKELSSNKDINILIDSRNTNFKDFIISNNGVFRAGLASGQTTEHRALHAIQEIRRKDDYIGTYPIIKGYANKDEPIYLDERATYILKNQQVQKPSSTENKVEYNASVKKILDYQVSTVGQILNTVNNQLCPIEGIDK